MAISGQGNAQGQGGRDLGTGTGQLQAQAEGAPMGKPPRQKGKAADLARRQAGFEQALERAAPQEADKPARALPLAHFAPQPGLPAPARAEAAPGPVAQIVDQVQGALARIDRPPPGEAAAAETRLPINSAALGIRDLTLRVSGAEIHVTLAPYGDLAADSARLAGLAQDLGRHIARRFYDREVLIYEAPPQEERDA